MVQVYFPILKQDDVIGRAGGKVEILDPVSTNYIDVFCYNSINDTYTIVENPIYLDNDGRPSQTYFVKQLAYLRLYDYLGDFTDPRTDDDSNNWSFVRDWYNSLDIDTGTGENLDVYGLYGLMDADVSLGSVDVVGYWTNDDCEKRTYVWDATCTAQPDAGYVVQSNSTEVGRWILLYDGEYLPSTYYGVYPGHQENINALLNYTSVVGSNELRTAPGVYFVKGNYTDSTVTLVTEKKLMCDADTSFTNEQIQCNHITVVGSSNHPVGDFYVLDTSCPVHSSWFRYPANFLACNSRDLYIDANNYFYNNTLNYNVTVSNAIIHGTNRLPLTYGTNGRITISNCVILGNNIFNSTDKVSFAYMEFRDDWFSNPASVDFYNNVMVRSVALNRLILSNFQNETAYVNAMGADGQTKLDMAGRSMYNFTCPTTVTQIYNLVCTNQMSINKQSTVDVLLNNVKCNDVALHCRYLTIENGCDVRFANEPSIDACWANDSTITGGYFFTSPAQYIFNTCKVNVGFKRVTDNTTQGGWLEFDNCEIGENNIIEAKLLQMRGCTTNNNTIKIYPYKDTNNVYHIFCDLRNNTFNNNLPIEFTKIDMINGSYDEDCYDCVLNWSIIGNTFNDNQGGLKCRYWQNRTGSRYNYTFVKWGRNLHNIKYYGNVGSCPAETPYGVTLTNGTGCESNFYWAELAEDTFVTLNKYTGAAARVMLDFESTTVYHWDSHAIGGNGFPVRTRYTGNDNSEFNCAQGCYVYPWSHLNDVIDNGDLFKVGFSKWGKVRENDPSYYPWTWRFLAVPGDYSSSEQT